MAEITGTESPAPEAFQVSRRSSSDYSFTKELLEQRQLHQQKRASLPVRPHGAARHKKRLTLNFPINVPALTTTLDSNVASPSSMTPVIRPSTRHSHVPTVGTPVAFDDQDDGAGLLTAIASQERKVLELREELQQAETELDSLKRQWESSEKTRKRIDISHRAEPLIPLRSPDRPGADKTILHSREHSVAGSESPSVTQPRLSRELERRHSVRAAAAKGTTISSKGRRVFQGSHTRTLSLLSPTVGSGSSPPASEVEIRPSDPDRMGRSPRSATLPSVERSPMVTSPTDDMVSQWRKTMPPPSREALVRTGKQMASDLREGLWTFLEDIRQATVGEEGINATESRAMPSRSSMHGGTSSRSVSSSRSKGAGAKLSGKDSKSADIDASFWSEFGIDTSGQQSPNTHRASTTPSGSNEPPGSNHLDIEDNWDEWETPQPKKTHTPSSSQSTWESKQDQSPITQASSPRTSTSFGDWRPLHDASVPDPSVSEGIPWPALTDLPSPKLPRTATDLMSDWEHRLSPSLHSPTFDPDHQKH
ncbi:hypothetical protein BDV28DRAFT_39343 [Aspergillus coremiiformis]|uniref:DUF4048 domain-containing protein n=1 Tax=Aspergillus coremiiformis TaxID=138285 RepID=A0A5N6Z1A0_9EURO|nr:hypothetical protein BDV28DRAFT_39343 [Aspergillus coremiiformis]